MELIFSYNNIKNILKWINYVYWYRIVSEKLVFSIKEKSIIFIGNIKRNECWINELG